MKRLCLMVLVLGLLSLGLLSVERAAGQTAVVNWIWFDEGEPGKAAPAETRYFRRSFEVRRSADEAILELTADNDFTAWINGVKLGSGNEWKQVYKFDIKQHIVSGKNTLAVQVRNTDGPAGLVVRLNYLPNGQSRQSIVSDDTWLASKTAADGWQKADFDDAKWVKAKVIGPVGEAGPWRELAWGGKGGKGPSDRFVVPEGFRVEQAVRIPDTDERFSLVNMCFDAKGRLLVSREGGAILLCTGANKDGLLETVKPYCEQVKNCQGMCWVKDSLYLVGNGPQGTGLYRVKDTNGDDKTDEVTFLHRTQGGMGEHGPHAVIHGPDDWLYMVIGNHCWMQLGPDAAKNGPNPEKIADNSPLLRWPTGRPGPDQGKIDTAEDVLLPRLNDANGHAANILAPGGTIWRFDHNGKNMGLFGAGYRNQFDAAFNPAGELFTFDSDMEWDEALPWYRHVRVTHVTPGSDYVWRTGAANTPNYYIDSLPPLVETGRGSPVGVEVYDHAAFPKKYQGAVFVCDWSLGIIYAVLPERDGASYKAKAEKFCTGNPLNVTDCAVAPDGSLYFTLGGRNTQGGVYRIVSTVKNERKDMDSVQPLSAWARARTQKMLDEAIKKDGKEKVVAQLEAEILPAKDAAESARRDPKYLLQMMQMHGLPPSRALLEKVSADKSAELRGLAVYLIGVNGYKESKETLLKALWDDDALVRRRACDALIRIGLEPPVEKVWPLLADKDQFVRTAARLVIQRIDPKKWADRLKTERNEHVGYEAIVALCKINQAEPYTDAIFERLHHGPPHDDVPALLNFLRTVQLALIHTNERPGSVRGLALDCLELFPHKDKNVDRELAILLTHFRTAGLLDDKVQDKLLAALLREKDDRLQQIHYFYCLRLLSKDAWTAEEKSDLLTWYDSTKAWQGGNSFTPFLFNILRDLSPIFTAEDRLALIAKGEERPWAAVALLRLAPPAEVPQPALLAELFERLAKLQSQPRGNDLKAFIVEALAKSTQQPEAQVALRKIADKDPSQRDVVARNLAHFQSPENFPYLIKGLESANKVVAVELIGALQKNPTKPKVDPMDPVPTPWRAALLASAKLDEKDRWKVVQLLRHWSNNRQFGGEQGDWKTELSSWSKWFGQNFPKEPALPNITAEKSAESKYKYAELLSLLESPVGRKGDVSRGRLVFEKAQCLKCHRFGKEGEGIGPDLTTLSKRFKRPDVLEALYFPSKVISDQYRSSVIVTKAGQQVVGLAAPQGDLVTVLLNDATKVTFKKSEIDQQFASLISVMPEKLLDTLTKEEIVDLFAYLESEPK